MAIEIVDGRPDHVPFIAWVLLTAARSQLEKSMFDLFVNGSEDESVRMLEALVTTDARHFANYERFIVTEVDGQPAAALTGYFVDEFDGPILGNPVREAALKFGWTEEQITAGWQRAAVFALVGVNRAPAAWIVEAVASRPEFRRMGLVNRMIEEMLERGRQDGATVSEISVFIGNDPAQRAYEKAGFQVVEEACHPLFESIVKCPGIRLLRRSI